MAASIEQEGECPWIYQGSQRTFMTLEQRIAAAYEELRMDVYRYVLTLGLPPEAAQDITQDGFVRFYETLRQGTTVENARAWLLRVAHNLAVNAVKARSFKVTELRELETTTTRTTEDRLIDEERRKRIRSEIAHLSTQQRACLELRAQGLRYREIAEIMEISTSAVGEFLKRAVTKLREALDE